MEEIEVYSGIQLLPNEILTMILQFTDFRDTVYFGSTCKRFLEFVRKNGLLWKEKFISVVPASMTDVLTKYWRGHWYNAYKHFHTVQQNIYTEINAMSPKFYWQCSEVSIHDVRQFFYIALDESINYYYVVHTLQDIVKKGNAYVNNNQIKKPYTLTEIYYAKIVLRYLMQTFIAVQWMFLYSRQELYPEFVVNFFLQWVDPVNMHPYADVDEKLHELVKKAELIINAQYPTLAGAPIKESSARGLPPLTVLNAIIDVVYRQRHMAVTGSANLETLDINKVLQSRCGTSVALGAWLSGAARRAGARTELVAFPDHLFLQAPDQGPPRRLVTVDLATGAFRPKRRCPYSVVDNDYVYSPEDLLHYVYTAYNMSMGVIKNDHTRNALLLLEFMGLSDNTGYSPYKNFLPFLFDRSKTTTLPDMKNLQFEEISMIRTLAQMNIPDQQISREIVVKRHASIVKYAVGMICYHKKFDYVGIIRGWDIHCDEKWSGLEMINLEFGRKQPFYHFIAADQSTRYVAQENLVEITKPTRLYHLEVEVAMDFTHFDGFSYVPNDEKRSEYPDEAPVTSLYRSRSQNRH